MTARGGRRAINSHPGKPAVRRDAHPHVGDAPRPPGQMPLPSKELVLGVGGQGGAFEEREPLHATGRGGSLPPGRGADIVVRRPRPRAAPDDGHALGAW